jgi:hypothetical protein
MYKKIPEEKRKTAKAMLKAGKAVHEVAKAMATRNIHGQGGAA